MSSGEVVRREFKDPMGNILELDEVDGTYYPLYHDHLAQQLKAVRQLHVRNDDIILCTYPKAGTHWMWEVLTMLINNSSDYSKLMKRTAMLENYDIDQIAAQPSPRVLNTHLLPKSLPDMALTGTCRLVVCHRNPKDICVSLYNMTKQVKLPRASTTFEGSFEGYASLFLDGTVPYGSFFDYVRAWEEARKTIPGLESRVYVTSYENMTRDSSGEILRIAKFLNTGASLSLCTDIANACSFKNMKEDCQNRKGGPAFWKPDSTGIFRKGKVGDWKNWMSDSLSARFDEASKCLSDLGIEFTYMICEHQEYMSRTSTGV